MTIVWEDDVTQLDAPHMNLLEQVARKGAANGYAALGPDGIVPLAQLPPIPPLVITDADIPAAITRDSELAAGLATKADSATVAALVAAKVDRDSVVVAGARLLASKLLVGDAQPAFYLGGSGDIAWGAGGAAALDNHLYRRGTDGWLRLDGSGLSLNNIDADQNVTADVSVIANLGSAAQVALGTVLGEAGVAFGAAPEITLYRKTADTLATSAVVLLANAGSGANEVAIGNGGITFGSDTSLSRIAANALRASGSLNAVTDVVARSGTARQIFIGDISGKPTLALGNAFDALLYRNGANLIRTDGTLDANALTINGVPVGGAADLTVKVDKDSVVVAATRIFASKLLAGDAQPAFRILGKGQHEWGAGGATAPDVSLFRNTAGRLVIDPELAVIGHTYVDGNSTGKRLFFGAEADTNLYRSAANQLKTDGNFSAASVALANPDATMYRGAAGRIDTNASLAILYGNLQFGSPPDTNLYRAAVGQLQTDGYLFAGASVYAWRGAASQVIIGSSDGTPGGNASVFFGSANDTALYRISASNLGTDSSLWVNNSLIVDNANGGGRLYFGSALDTTLWRLAAGQVQTDGYFIAKADIVARDGIASKVRIGDLIGNGAPGIAFGAAGGDVNLSRATLAAAGRGVGLKVGGHLGAGADFVARDGGSDQVVVGNHNGVAGIELGSAGDTLLYRSAAGVLGASFGALGTRDIVYGAADSGGAGFRAVRVAN